MMKKIFGSICAASVLLVNSAFPMCAYSDISSKSINTDFSLTRTRYAEKIIVDGKAAINFYLQNAQQYEMFFAKTDIELKADTQYLVTFSYKSAEFNIQPQLGVMNKDNEDAFNGNSAIGYLAASYREAYSEWRTVSFAVDTTGKVTDTNKWLGFACKNFTAAANVDYTIANLNIKETGKDFEYTSFKHFGYIDDGERQYADYTCPSSYYTEIGFGARINAEPSKKYIFAFDYKRTAGGFNSQPVFKIGDTVVSKPSLEGTAEWKTVYSEITTPDTIDNNEIVFEVFTYEGRTSLSFDNIRLIPLSNDLVYPAYYRDMEYYITDSEEYAWKFAPKASNYVLTGFVTDYELESNCTYKIKYEYRQTAASWNAGNSLFFGITDTADSLGFENAFNNRNERLGSLNLSLTDKWTQNTEIISTKSISNNGKAYLAVCGQTLNLPYFEFKNLQILKLSGAVAEPSNTVGMEKTAENGEAVWKSTDSARVAGIATGFEAECGTYTIGFDYKISSSRQLSGEVAFCLTEAGDFSDTACGQPLSDLTNDGKWHHTEIPYRISAVEDKNIISVSARLAAKKIKISLKNISVHRITQTEDEPPRIFFNDDTRGIRYSAKDNCDLVYDGGFETDDWSDLTYDSTVSVTDSEHRNGARSLEFSASALKEQSWSVKYYDVEPNSDYYIALWVKGEKWSRKNSCDMTFGIIDVLSGKFIECADDRPIYTAEKQMVIPAWDDEWHFVNLAFNTGSANRIGIGFSGADSTAYFDDISMFKAVDRQRIYPPDQQREGMYLTDNMINDYTEGSFSINSDGDNTFLKLDTITALNEYKILTFQTTYQLKPDSMYRVKFKFKDEYSGRSAFAEGLYAITGNGAHGSGAAYVYTPLSDKVSLKTNTNKWNTVSFTVDTSICSSGEKVVNEKNKFLSFYLKAYELSSYSLLFDDFEIENLSDETAEKVLIDFETKNTIATCEEDDNVISNYNFAEIENDFWSSGLGYGYNVQLTDTGTDNGKALKFKSNNQLTGYPIQTSYIKWISVKPHTDYTLSADLKVLESGNGYFAIIDGSYYYPRILSKVVFSELSETEWKRSTISFNSGGFERIGFIITDKGGEAYLDNIRLFETVNAKPVTDKVIPEHITSSIYSGDENSIILIDTPKALADLKTYFDNSDYIKFRNNGSIVEDESAAAYTGLEILIYDYGKVYDKAYIAVKFDIDGNGEVNSADIVLLRKHLLCIGEFSAAQKRAVQKSSVSGIDITDLIRIKKYISLK